MELALVARGHRVRVIEDCRNGRRTAWEDPFKPGRNGLVGVEQRIEVNSPLALVIVLLGTNDFQSIHPHNAWQSAEGLRTLLRAVRRAPIEPGMPTADILVVCPPPVGEPKGTTSATPRTTGTTDGRVHPVGTATGHQPDPPGERCVDPGGTEARREAGRFHGVAGQARAGVPDYPGGVGGAGQGITDGTMNATYRRTQPAPRHCRFAQVPPHVVV